jgi:hypothetical protein
MTLQIDQDLALYGIAQVIVSYTAHDLGAKRESMGAVAYAAMAAKRARGGDPLSDFAMGKPVGSVMSIGRQRTGMHEV